MMKKTTRLLLIGTFLMISGFIFLDITIEKIIPASLFIIGGGFYVESARLMLIQSK